NMLAAQAKDAEAVVEYQRALQFDPNLGRAYSGWAISAAKLGRADESTELWKKALAQLDRMTEREKYRTLGTYYSRVVGNQAAAIERSEEHTSELQSPCNLVCRLLLEKKKCHVCADHDRSRYSLDEHNFAAVQSD